jgi:hypothetical protein
MAKPLVSVSQTYHLAEAAVCAALLGLLPAAQVMDETAHALAPGRQAFGQDVIALRIGALNALVQGPCELPQGVI